MKLFKMTLIALCSTLVACSNAPTPNAQFYTPGTQNPEAQLAVPPDLSSISNPNRYQLPLTGAVRASQLNNIQAEQSNQVLPQEPNMTIQREGSERWLNIRNVTPEQVWTSLKTFWKQNGFTIAKEEPQIGFMETQWAENRAAIPMDGIRKLFESIGLGNIYSSDERDKFITRIERVADGVNVTFVNKGMKEVFTGRDKETTIWQPRPSDPNLEAQMLGRFMVMLGAKQDEVKQQFTQANTTEINQLAHMDGHSLILNGRYDRNAHRLQMALSRIGLNVLSYNPATGVFVVQQIDENLPVQPGFFSRLFGESKKPAKPHPLMRIGISANPDNTADTVRFYLTDGQIDNSQSALHYLERLLVELH